VKSHPLTQDFGPVAGFNGSKKSELVSENPLCLRCHCAAPLGL